MILFIILSILFISLFVNILVIYIDATNVQIDTSKELEIEKRIERKNIFTGWIQKLSTINNKDFVFPSTEAKIVFPNKKESK